MAQTEGCAKHQSCDCIQIQEALDAADEDAVLPKAWQIACDLRIGGHEIEELGLPFEGYAAILHRLADDLEDIVAHLRGQRRYTVEVRCGTVFAEDEEEAVRKAEIADCRTTDYETEVEHRPLTEPVTSQPEDPEEPQEG